LGRAARRYPTGERDVEEHERDREKRRRQAGKPLHLVGKEMGRDSDAMVRKV
jgi:hypothetical protein